MSIIVVAIIATSLYMMNSNSKMPKSESTPTSKKESSKHSESSAKSSSSASSVSSSSATSPELSTSDAETKLNSGESIDGKIVDVEIYDIDNTNGQNLQAGEHLNFYPQTQQYGLKAGDHVMFKVTGAKSALGSWIISGDVVK